MAKINSGPLLSNKRKQACLCNYGSSLRFKGKLLEQRKKAHYAVTPRGYLDKPLDNTVIITNTTEATIISSTKII